MARVKKIENNLVKPYIKHRNRAIPLFVIGGVLIVSSFLMDPLIILTLGLLAPLSMLLFVAGGVCLLFGALNFNKAEIYKSGLVGEATSENVLSDLPDDYYLFPSIDIEFEGRKSQIDHLVVGPTGVFIVESKNINGDIVGSDDDNHITIHKIGQKGGEYQSTIYNPIKQVSTHVYRTSGYLREQGIDVWVQGMVYFTNPTSTVHLESKRIPVFSENEDGGRELYNYILNYEGKRNLNEKEINRIVDAIERNLDQQKSSNKAGYPYVTEFDILKNKYQKSVI
ncbi:MAG: nuclease-related domain-containing protein [Caldicoprobacterales bacterium]